MPGGVHPIAFWQPIHTNRGAGQLTFVLVDNRTNAVEHIPQRVAEKLTVSFSDRRRIGGCRL
jgi:hypothetical protein